MKDVYVVIEDEFHPPIYLARTVEDYNATKKLKIILPPPVVRLSMMMIKKNIKH